MNNPFEAAIETLGYAQEGLGYWRPNPYPDLGTTWAWNSPEAENKYNCLRAAIRVLEAAGKVDKDLAQRVFNWHPGYTKNAAEYETGANQIDALLAALKSALSKQATPTTGEEERREMAFYIDNLQANGRDLDLGMGDKIKSILLAPRPGDTMDEPIQIVFDGPPGPISGRFVEVEKGGRGIAHGEWKHREDGYWVLELPVAPPMKVTRAELDALLRTYECDHPWQYCELSDVEELLSEKGIVVGGGKT